MPELMVLAVLMAGPAIKADTIYRINPQGRQEVLQRNAIVVRQDSAVLVYKHFNLQLRRVEKVQLTRGSLPYVVVTSSAQDRLRIVDLWKQFGYTATVTDSSGKTTRVFDSYIDFFPPAKQGTFFEVVPAITSFILQPAAGGADDVAFSEMAEAQIQDGVIKLRLRDGRVKAGKFLIPTSQPAEVRFLGITNAYNPSSEDVYDFSKLLSHIKEIQFEP
jgi:hypothetical protein